MVVEFAEALGDRDARVRMSADVVTVIEREISGRVDGAAGVFWIATRDDQEWWVVQRADRPTRTSQGPRHGQPLRHPRPDQPSR